jgi:hypothetical protein
MIKNKFNSFLTLILLCSIGMISNSIAQEEPDSVDIFKASVNAYPYVFYTPETEFAFGGGGILAFYTARDSILNPSSVTLSGYYSTNKSYSIYLKSNFFFF